MNSLTTWNPFKELDDLRKRLGAWSGASPSRGDVTETTPMAQWAPLVDISENEKEFLIKAELPEVKKEDVKVTVEKGVLTLSGERKIEKEEKTTKFHRVERSYGSFLRSFGLPEGVDPANVAAEFKDGLLLVRLPKTEKAKPQTVDVKVL
jgi:HSP20 family protein